MTLTVTNLRVLNITFLKFIFRKKFHKNNWTFIIGFFAQLQDQGINFCRIWINVRIYINVWKLFNKMSSPSPMSVLAESLSSLGPVQFLAQIWFSKIHCKLFTRPKFKVTLPQSSSCHELGKKNIFQNLACRQAS